MLNIERLKELREETEQYRTVADDRCMSTNYEDDLLTLIDEAIARQAETEKVVCPDCGGSGVYQEYDEYDRYYVHACHGCEGAGEIARQSIKSEDVAEAIETLKNENGFTNGKWYRAVDLAITALQACHKQTPVKPTARFYPDGSVESTCSNCQEVIEEGWFIYCPECGQAIDWREE